MGEFESSNKAEKSENILTFFWAFFYLFSASVDQKPPSPRSVF